MTIWDVMLIVLVPLSIGWLLFSGQGGLTLRAILVGIGLVSKQPDD